MQTQESEMSRCAKAALGLGIAGLTAAAVGAFMIHTGFGVLVLGAYAVISAKQVLETEQLKAMQEQVKDQLGDLGKMFQ
jgi:hypothetical protein